MQTCVVSVYGSGGSTRLLHELVGMLTHRQVDLRAMNAALEHHSCVVQLSVAASNEAAVELLVKRITRLVGVVRAIRHDDQSTPGDLTFEAVSA